MTRREWLAGALAAQAAARRPNVVFILVDDLRWDELGAAGHPFAETPHVDRLAREGIYFREAFATTPLCSPSRASFLTGLYAHTHGIIDNTNRSAASHKLLTWPRLLHEAGYETAFIGKWHMGNDDSRRPGFDHWVSFRGQGEAVDPVLNVDGRTARAGGYITDLLIEHAVAFLRRRRRNPFCLYLAHKAVHPNVQQRDDGSISGAGGAESFIPAARHRGLYAGRKIPRRPNYAVEPRDKPALMRALPGLAPLGAGTVTDDQTILNRMRMMKSVDEGLGQILETLDRLGTLDDTVVAFTSDHGYFYGEHGLGAERRLAYEEAIRIPLLVRYPRIFRPGSESHEMVLSIDLAPTLLEMAGVRAPRMHGRSLITGRPREAILIEYFSDRVFPRILRMGYQAVRTKRWKYIRYTELAGMDELYDLGEDPYELCNLATNPAAARILQDLKRRLRELLAETGAVAALSGRISRQHFG